MNTARPEISRILLLHQGTELYGSDRSLLRNIQCMEKAYPQAVLSVILPGEGPLAERLRQMPSVKLSIRPLGVLRRFDIQRGNFSALRRLVGFLRLARLFDTYDLVAINSSVILDAIAAARFTRTPVMIHVREIPTGPARLVLGMSLKFSNAHVAFVSKAVQNCFRGFGLRKAFTLWNGCPPVMEKMSGANQRAEFRLLMPGRINHWKGQDLLVEAIALLPGACLSRLKVDIVGDVFADQHHFKERLQDKIRTLGLGEVVQIHPFSDNITDFYRAADAVVVPSTKPEPFGLVATEAMSAGLPVIAAGHGGLNEIVEHGVTGLLFTPCNAEALCRRLAYLLDHPAKSREMGIAAKERYHKFFHADVYCDNYTRHVVEVLAAKR